MWKTITTREFSRAQNINLKRQQRLWCLTTIIFNFYNDFIEYKHGMALKLFSIIIVKNCCHTAWKKIGAILICIRYEKLFKKVSNLTRHFFIYWRAILCNLNIIKHVCIITSTTKTKRTKDHSETYFALLFLF